MRLGEAVGNSFYQCKSLKRNDIKTGKKGPQSSLSEDT